MKSANRSLVLAAATLVTAASSTVAAGDAAAEPLDAGFTVSVGGGVNVDAVFATVQAGRRFERAPHVEVYLDYSYGRPISTFAFHTFGLGVRTQLKQGARIGWFHQAGAALAVSSSGERDTPNRELGERLLGAFMTQGLGVAVRLDRDWRLRATVLTGYPVWLRGEVALEYTF